ncbi:hypothetical protein BJY16_008531 [Actinoplanes octamycinicus]|uniref:Peptidase C14 caspase domain-containing protein n=1 Tax=Actinoplanes octamycinicus TaxID=135948 RepID=A0A7W7H7I6_9ACTN|nr:caspase family protein [Actinoplanes octamycinicus]MBB4745072.1 hypothetical protein [Actinoplanes octamycinicus]GIE55658.1 hypothetical protein Aoc01nite_10600 [Actinoplanes octamycinicus]
MPDLYALLVGIDRYRSPDIPPLHGCANDVRAAAAQLTIDAAPGCRVHTRLLLDDDATRAAVIAAIRAHLGRAGRDDTALLWFAGHGSAAPVPDWAWFREPTGRLQTLVCADSRTPGVPDLWDKELSVLLDVVAERARHVAVVLDSCHADGATRELLGQEPAARARSVPPAPDRGPDSLIEELLRRAGQPAPEHVALAACRSDEAARERTIGGTVHGVFSWALLDALRRLGPDATYRELLAATQTAVELRSGQVPQLRPAASPLADHEFLDGTVRRAGTGIRMRHTREGWAIDAGAVHGLPEDGGVRVGVHGTTREATVTRVRALTSLVEPCDGWQPRDGEQFPVVLTDVPLPRATVAVAGLDPAGLAASPHVRVVDGDTTVPDLRIRTGGPGRVTITDHHGAVLTETDTGRLVPAVEHLARWWLLSRLANPASSLGRPVRIELLRPAPGQELAPRTGGEPLSTVAGVYRLPYRWSNAGWQPPEFFLRLHNTTDRKLYCVLLDLTPRFKAHALLFPGDFIGPGERGVALDGQRVRAFLPDRTAPRPGVRVRDRLKLFVAEEQFSQQPFLMPELGEPVGSRGGFGRRGLLERLGGQAIGRDLGAAREKGAAYEWTTETVNLEIVVPRLGEDLA